MAPVNQSQRSSSRVDREMVVKASGKRNSRYFKKGWGSIKEGKGFAFQQKAKIKHQYKKILRKEKRAQHPQDVEYADNYPDHLRHLYLAEEELLKKQSKKVKREEPVTSQPDSQPEAPKKKKKKTSYQKTKEEYEKRQAEYKRKKEEAEKRQKEKEEAQMKYKEQKLERYRMLCKKTRTGQPNLNLQMEYLLNKIQERT
ncbi:thyroid transcription factor 1-associated protein 26 homolog isoform X1 [Hemitrygon akajei]|uniref:thyroid transcription factor 1-associated protein 26 homolog isoform X1 n=1 Tax=Hemitrygon akajei TaxID=2704970 RepID=UPI003BFA29DE